MSFSKMVEYLQVKNKGKIVFVNAGNFYIAMGKDAVLLHQILDLKTSCMKPEVCKVGFPIIALEKYSELLCEKNYSFIVYFFNKNTEELEVILDYNGKYKNELENLNINCYICKKSTRYYKQDDKYLMAVSKLYDKEIKESEEKLKKKDEKEKWYKINQKKKNIN